MSAGGGARFRLAYALALEAHLEAPGEETLRGPESVVHLQLSRRCIEPQDR